MIDPAILDKAGPWPVLPVMQATVELAQDVREGRRNGKSACPMPQSLRTVLGSDECKTVDQAISTGVMLIASSAVTQQGPGAAHWPSKLQAWLGNWEQNFRSSDDGDERAGFARLVGLLGEISNAIAISSVIQ